MRHCEAYAMTHPTDPLLQYEYGGTIFFLPSVDNSSAICKLEFTIWGEDIVARISLRDTHYQIEDELLLCPDGENRLRSKRGMCPYGTSTTVQLVLIRDRLTHVIVGEKPHLRVVGEWIERKEDKAGKVRTETWGIEGLLKRSGVPSARLDQKERDAIDYLRRNWRQVCE